MGKLQQQTKQAFFLSLGFYLLALFLKIAHYPFGNILLSISLLLSLIWVVLALREIMLSTRVTNTERIFLVLFVIFGNILAGLAYFFFIRERVIARTVNTK